MKNTFELSYGVVILVTVVILFFILPFISYYNKKRIAKKIPLAIVKKDIEKEAKKIDKLIEGLDKESDFYKLRYIAYRIKVELNKYNLMSNGIYPQFCLDHRMYFMYIFRSVLDILGKGDVYRTVTTIDIWQFDEDDKKLLDGYPGLQKEYKKSFLKSNVEAAKRLVNIERFFIIDELASKNINSAYSINLRDTVQRLVNELDHDTRECKIFFCPTKNYVNETKKDIAFALIRNEENTSFMYLYSNNTDMLPSIEMNFLDNNEEVNYQRLYKKLKYYRDKSGSEKFSLEQMAKKLGISKNNN
ncbi:hypothetical protein [Flavivirga spongiicola]|uniref:Uncharacterized protein n=1 Tax=Flavivirga spongiicola TaxID=421621 RepID=A0ABU7XM30_9FLAO|nr:hypothetical protein [Flavivirga sp. MEBiC05379]MDO5981481.1 hypothetical protein [Flavivirga sp. MEBiC05379]